MIIILGTKKYVNIFKVRCYVYMCIFVCMAKHGQISFENHCNGVGILK